MNNHRIAIIGLGYVGLPLATEFAKVFPVVGFDVNVARIEELRTGFDRTLEVDQKTLRSVIAKSSLFALNGQENVAMDIEPSLHYPSDDDYETGLVFSNDLSSIAESNIYIITVPTPVDRHNRPDLTPLLRASETVGGVLKSGDIVIYESTVYPGVTEDECVPILQNKSGLIYNKDFFCGYSPERINPGDKEHTLTKIRKVTSGSTPTIAEIVDNLYSSIIAAGTHKASSIRVAEAAKVIENAQRDINIAFVNELAKIFNRLGIDTNEVLEAAGSKWNFLPFKPGLVGGHCIGVDPYYLAQKAEEVGYHPEILLAGRRLNDSMGSYVADEVIRKMVRKGIQVVGSRALVLGITFKENCPDVRNTRVVDIIRHLNEYHIDVDIHDPWADPAEVLKEYNVTSFQHFPEGKKYDAVILAVAHREFEFSKIRPVCSDTCVIYDVKAILDKSLVDGRL